LGPSDSAVAYLVQSGEAAKESSKSAKSGVSVGLDVLGLLRALKAVLKALKAVFENLKANFLAWWAGIGAFWRLGGCT
jgi:hypothetical protein